MRPALKLALLAALAVPLAAPALPSTAAQKCLEAGDKVSGQMRLTKTGENTYAAILITRRPVCAWVTVEGGERRQLRGQKLLLAFDGVAPRIPANRDTVITLRGRYAPPIAGFPGDLTVLHTEILRVNETDSPPPAPPPFRQAKPGGFDSAN